MVNLKKRKKNDCIKSINKTLDNVPRNNKSHILGIIGCDKASKRLSELGIYKGASVVVLKNDAGPLIIQLSGNKIALGRCLANKIIVSDIKG